mgnify:CR=1 FL=1
MGSSSRKSALSSPDREIYLQDSDFLAADFHYGALRESLSRLFESGDTNLLLRAWRDVRGRAGAWAYSITEVDTDGLGSWPTIRRGTIMTREQLYDMLAELNGT